MKKSITTISILIITFVFLAPQVAMAVWWNPFTWFKKKSVPIPVKQVSVQTIEKEATQQPVPQAKEKKEVVVNSKPVAKDTPKVVEKKSTKVESTVTQKANNPEPEPVQEVSTPEYAPLKPFVPPLGYIKPPEIEVIPEKTPIISNPVIKKEIGTLGFTSNPSPNRIIFLAKEEGVPDNLATAKNATDQTLWEAVASVGIKDLEITSLKLRQIGSIQSHNLTNLKLYINGSLVTSTSSVDINGYTSFDFSAVKLKIGGVSFKLMGDINGAALGRTNHFSLRNSSDIYVIDTETREKISVSGIPTNSGSQAIQFPFPVY